MAQQTAIPSLAPIRNVVLMAELVNRLRNRGENLPGMGVFYGPSGWGKSKAAAVSAVRYQAYYVEMRSIWTRKALLEAVCAEMRISPARTMPRILDQIAQQLGSSRRVLIIDEADYAAESKSKIEVIRDMYEASQGGLVMIGEELLPEKLKIYERVHGRVLSWVPAQPANESDLDLLKEKVCPALGLDEDLKSSVLAHSGGSVRRLCTNLELLREFAAARGLDELTTQSYTGELYTGQAPERTR